MLLILRQIALPVLAVVLAVSLSGCGDTARSAVADLAAQRQEGVPAGILTGAASEAAAQANAQLQQGQDALRAALAETQGLAPTAGWRRRPPG